MRLEMRLYNTKKSLKSCVPSFLVVSKAETGRDLEPRETEIMRGSLYPIIEIHEASRACQISSESLGFLLA